MSLRVPAIIFLTSLACAWGCESGADNEVTPQGPPTEDRLLEDPLGDLPGLLSQVGLYDDMLDRSQVDARAIPYAPAWPLWSSGSEKERFLVLPTGAQVDNAEAQAWDFPVGTLLFKTFSFFEANGEARPVETRLMRRMDDGDWDYGVWLWNEEGDDAELLEIKKTLPVAVLGPNGESFEHVVPNRLQCRKCHEADPNLVLGLSELQVGQEDDNGDSDLKRLHERGAFAVAPSAEPETLSETDPLTRWVIGYAQGNCVHCHNGLEGPANSFDLHHSVFLENTVGAETQSTWGIGLRVVPGVPGESMLFVGMSGETDDTEIKDMPPVGVAIRDTEAIEKYREWILSLPTEGSQDPP